MTLTLKRPALITSDAFRLNEEFRSARWIHHRLLDFEDEHQRVLDAAAEQAAPGILRVGRILACLARRQKRRERSAAGTWSPDPKPELAARLKVRLGELRDTRNGDARWIAALAWADEEIGAPKKIRRRRAKHPSKVKRRKNESDEAWAKRFALLTSDETDDHYLEKLAKAPKRTRREQYRADLYKQRRCYWGTWNALVKSVDQARADVLRQRKQGMPAEWHRPKSRDPLSLAADAGGFRIIERSALWWTIALRIGIADDWVTIRAKCGNWHDVPDAATITTAKLTRRRNGERWSYALSLTIDGAEKRPMECGASGVVAFDWGHREHGHPGERDGIRAFVWIGDDGQTGEILLPAECRTAQDEIDALKSRLDATWDARRSAMRLPERSRQAYRARLMQSGLRTLEESDWLQWEMRYERRIAKRRKRIANLRRETYIHAVRGLRQRYATFVFEAESNASIKRKQKEAQIDGRKRQNRDMTARYEFTALCERFGAALITVPARNTTRECPDCGHLCENGPELMIACPGCGVMRDKDHGARRVILRRGQEALANRAA